MKGKSILAVALMAVAVLASSCDKTPKEESEKLVIEVTEITATTAVANISVSGIQPTMTRLFSATELSELDINIEDVDAVAAYATKNGSAISVPYTADFAELEPVCDYAVGAVCFDANMQVIAAKAVKFTTAKPDNAISEGGDGAGSVTERNI